MTRERTIKQRYEENANVQRWLKRDEILDRESTQLDSDDARPDFNPAFLSEHHERDWILSSLETFYNRQLIDDIVGVARSGKEATVYCCAAHSDVEYPLLAAKSYRPRMFRSLQNDDIYRHNRAQRDGRGNIIRNRRALWFANSNTQRGMMEQVGAWIHHEYQTLRKLHAAGCAVPEPIDQAGNAILMEFIGDSDGPAPLLLRCNLKPAAARRAFNKLMVEIARMLASHVIHGDLSAYNILYWNDEPIIIDVAQSVDPRYSLEVYPLLERDITQIARYFQRYGIQCDPIAIASDLWTRYLVDELAV